MYVQKVLKNFTMNEFTTIKKMILTQHSTENKTKKNTNNSRFLEN